jgi:hypothetical protein
VPARRAGRAARPAFSRVSRLSPRGACTALTRGSSSPARRATASACPARVSARLHSPRAIASSDRSHSDSARTSGAATSPVPMASSKGPPAGTRSPPASVRPRRPTAQRRLAACREVQPRRPPFGSPVQLRHLIRAQRDRSLAQQRCRFFAGERQVLGADLEDFALGAQPRDAQRRLGAPGERQPGATGHVIGERRQCRPADRPWTDHGAAELRHNETPRPANRLLSRMSDLRAAPCGCLLPR